MTIEPVTYNMTIYQGATFRQNFTWHDSEQEPVDLTGYTARLMARTSIGAEEAFIELTTENGGIELGGEEGTVTLYMSASQTAALEEDFGVYDLELQAPAAGDTVRFVQGNITINREVTR